MTFDRSRVMRTAHAEWRATKHKPGMTFGRCLALAWAVEKRRAKGREYYQPPLDAALHLTFRMTDDIMSPAEHCVSL